MTTPSILPPPTDAVWQSKKTPHRFFLELSRRFGDVVPYREAPHPAFLINHPDHLRHTLVSHPERYRKDTLAYNVGVTKMLFGKGLVTNEGAPWRRQRRLVQPAFQRAKIASFCPTITQTAVETFDALAPRAQHAQPVDLAAEIAPLMLGIIGKVLFSVDLRAKADAIGAAFAAVLATIPPAPGRSDRGGAGHAAAGRGRVRPDRRASSLARGTR